ncbi:S-layer homology domain-containing protein [Solibacillus sp. FSL W8-0372]|uniref:S-layer homology domain-containing protein n=1 Tax=Solibacillus sp. FSL W8-0372 TaxID=2921713 RepID=UPI0030CFEB14
MKLRHNKVALMALSLSLMTPVFVAPTTTDAATDTKLFKDVTIKNPNFEIIHLMADKGIISGYPDGTFKPNQTLSRKHAAALITRTVKTLPKTTVFKAPKDLLTKNAYYNDMKILMEAGLLELDKKGNIKPDAPLTRGEMAKIITTAYQLDTTGQHPFRDVSSKYNSYITALYEANVTSGYEDGTFRENTYLTRAHYTAFIYRALREMGKMPGTELTGDIFLPTNYTSEDYRRFVLAYEYLIMGDNRPSHVIHPLFPSWTPSLGYEVKPVKYLMKTGENEYYYSDDVAKKIAEHSNYSMPTPDEVEQFVKKDLKLNSTNYERYDNVNGISFFHNPNNNPSFNITLPKKGSNQQANNIVINAYYNNKEVLNQFLAYLMKTEANKAIDWYEEKMKILYNPLYMHQASLQTGYFAKQFSDYLIQFNIGYANAVDVRGEIIGSPSFLDDKLHYFVTITTADQLKIIESAPLKPIEFKQEAYDKLMRDVMRLHGNP